ncbi:hypothetical protein OG339_23905 [Streptosporangium sp. NBC_01495]|uniref:hypothetical protein n=1 Tax=Streptosporangium sp. NBC_01495 TaxID=2903899 RepID=UPI002E323EA3|nr:hypothetical protein [Streptosporangium sp. NBC_01495]
MNLPVASPAGHLPPVEPHVVASAVEDLTPRLRRKLDAAIERCAGLPIAADGQNISVSWGEDATVTLTPGPSGTIADPGAARCCCLLAPRCLHRAAVLSACPVADPDPQVSPDPLVDMDVDVDTGPGQGSDTTVDPVADPVPVSGGKATSVAGPVRETKAGASTGAGAGASSGSGSGSIPASGAASGSNPVPVPGPNAGQVAAATGLWDAAGGILAGGVPGAGAVPQAELLRAAHTARVAGLHRAEAAALRVVRELRAARACHDGHRLADLVSALRELLLTASRLAAADPDPALVGTARRAYRQGEGLRVYGVCREPVISTTGYGGVITHLVAEDGRRFSIADVKPGGSARARGAATATVALGAAAVNHAQLARGGLLISGTTISPDGRLGAGRSVRANPVAGLSWSEGPLAALFARSLASAADATFSGASWSDPQDDGGAGQPLVGCDLVIVGAEGDRLLARELPPPTEGDRGGSDRGGSDRGGSDHGESDHGESGRAGSDPPLVSPGPSGAAPLSEPAAGRMWGPLIRLVPADSHPELAHVDNLRRLASRPGLRVRVIGRLDPGRAATLRPLAVGPVPGAGPTLRLPAEWLDRADLGYDRLQGSHLPPRDDCPPWREPAEADADPVASSPLWRARRLVELAVSGGRRAVAESARGGDSLAQRAPLRRAGFETSATLVAALTEEADRRTRDVFGRLVDSGGDRYAWAWLAAAVHLTATERALVRASWHDGHTRRDSAEPGDRHRGTRE